MFLHYIDDATLWRTAHQTPLDHRSNCECGSNTWLKHLHWVWYSQFVLQRYRLWTKINWHSNANSHNELKVIKRSLSFLRKTWKLSNLSSQPKVAKWKIQLDFVDFLKNHSIRKTLSNNIKFMYTYISTMINMDTETDAQHVGSLETHFVCPESAGCVGISQRDSLVHGLVDCLLDALDKLQGHVGVLSLFFTSIVPSIWLNSVKIPFTHVTCLSGKAANELL